MASPNSRAAKAPPCRPKPSPSLRVVKPWPKMRVRFSALAHPVADHRYPDEPTPLLPRLAPRILYTGLCPGFVTWPLGFTSPPAEGSAPPCPVVHLRLRKLCTPLPGCTSPLAQALHPAARLYISACASSAPRCPVVHPRLRKARQPAARSLHTPAQGSRSRPRKAGSKHQQRRPCTGRCRPQNPKLDGSKPRLAGGVLPEGAETVTHLRLIRAARGAIRSARGGATRGVTPQGWSRVHVRASQSAAAAQVTVKIRAGLVDVATRRTTGTGSGEPTRSFE
jgi:hypothetical protein